MSARIPAARGERDANHGDLARLYQSMGCSVVDTHALGFGFPDAIVGLVGVMDLVEFKTEDGELNPAQIRFHRDWRGPPARIVRGVSDVINHVSEIRKKARRGEQP